jgi:hypothetical protein
MEWALPREVSTGLMKAPYSPVIQAVPNHASSILAKEGDGDPGRVQFGNFFSLPACVINSISQTYDSIFDKNGKPLSAKVDVSVTSVTAITVSDIPNMLLP